MRLFLGETRFELARANIIFDELLYYVYVPTIETTS